jgi:hypothetical protein
MGVDIPFTSMLLILSNFGALMLRCEYQCSRPAHPWLDAWSGSHYSLQIQVCGGSQSALSDNVIQPAGWN